MRDFNASCDGVRYEANELYKKITSLAGQIKKNDDAMTYFNITYNGCTKKASLNQNWSSLKKINLIDLLLFKPMSGCMIEGSIKTRSFIMTSVMFVIQDSQGEMYIVGLYNYIKDQN